MGTTVTYPSFFRYEPRGYYVFTDVCDAFRLAEEIANRNFGDSIYDPPLPITNSELFDLEKVVVEAAKTFNGQHFAPTFFKNLSNKIVTVRKMIVDINNKSLLSDKISRAMESPTPAAYKLLRNEFLIHKVNDGKRLLKLALRHRLIWNDGLHTIELSSAKTAGTDFRCVICYEEFSLSPRAKKAWPKPCRDYPVCSESCAISLEDRASASIKVLEGDLIRELNVAYLMHGSEIYSLKRKIVEELSVLFKECADCQNKMVRTDADAFKKFHAEYGTNMATYHGRCHSCLGIFLPKSDRKRDFFKPIRPKRKPLAIFSGIFKGITNVFGWGFKFVLFMVMLGIGLALIALSLRVSLFFYSILIGGLQPAQ